MIESLVNKLKTLNINIELVDGDKLKIHADKKNIGDEMLNELVFKKQELIQYLKECYTSEDFELIPAIAIASNYPLSSSQRRLWILSQFEEGNVAYNVPGVYVLEGDLDQAALHRSFQQLIARHEILRTTFKENEQGEIRQFITRIEEAVFQIKNEDLRDIKGNTAKLNEKIAESFAQPFSLDQGPLLRAALYQLEDHKWIFAYCMHHIISDGWSMEVLIKELLILYNSDLAGLENPLPSLRIQYKDYACWQQDQLKGDSLNKHRRYWQDHFSGELPLLEFPTDKIRPGVKTYNGGSVHKIINTETSNGFKELVQQEGATLFMGLLGAVNALLYRYTGQDDIIIGSPIAGREHSDLSNQIGFYVNTLALRTRMKGEADFKELLKGVKEVTLNAYEHQLYPFDELVDLLKLQRQMNRHPLFDVLITLQNLALSRSENEQLGNLQVNTYQAANQVVSKFDFSFSFRDTNSGIVFDLDYNTDLYDADSMKRLADHLEQLIATIVENPFSAIQEIEFLKEAEKQELLQVFNARKADYAKEKTVVDLFEEQVTKTSDQVALVFEDHSLTYTKLNERANQLGNYLRKKYKIKPGELVGIQLDRSEWMVVSILGVLKSGAAYVPIDPEYPQDRIAYMLADTRCKVVIDQEELMIWIKDIDLYKKKNLSQPIVASQLAYIIYTSGSTGFPKGVSINHGNLAHFLAHVRSYYETPSSLVQPFVASSAFDISLFQLFAPLLSGGTSQIISKAQFQNMHAFTAVLKSSTYLDTVPAVYQLLVNYITAQDLSTSFKQVKGIFIGGDVIADGLLQRLSELFSNAKIIVTYGPTEGTVFCTDLIYAPGSISAETKGTVIGSPINNTFIYILDGSQHLIPMGAVGEICIGGDGVARGYLNNPELTKEKFISNPFKVGERIYKTGDLGRWLADGKIEFMGRKDTQVKIRGHRIELGEIETALLSYESVTGSVVLARSTASEDKELIAYVVCKGTLNTIALRAHLSTQLPTYMLPSHYVQLESLPLTVNGKIDRKSLPAPEEQELSSGVNYVAPRNEREEKLVKIWEEILGKETIGIHDNFFEQGGHSLKATRLLSNVHKEFGVRLNMADIFANPFLETQAQLIRDAAPTAHASIPAVSNQFSYPLSSSQRRLWILSQFEEGNVAYNVPGVYVLEGDLDQAVLHRSFQQLIARHEILRTTFKENEQGEIRQFITRIEEAVVQIKNEDLRDIKDNTAKLKEKIAESFAQPFLLDQGPLLQVALYQLEDHKWIFAYCMHHIISDGWSMEVLIKELITLYNNDLAGLENPLPSLRIQYKDYACWQQDQLKGDSLNKHRRYWQDHFSGELPLLEFPTDKIRPGVKTYNGGSVHKIINSETSNGFKELVQQEGATLFMGLLGAVNALLYRYTGQDDIIIGSPIAGREHSDLSNQIGFYVNILALRTRMKGEADFKELLKGVKEVTLNAYEHQLYPFDELVEQLQLQREMNRHPLFDVTVSLQNSSLLPASLQIMEGLQINSYGETNQLVSKFDFTFGFVETASNIQLRLEYNTDLYDGDRMQRLADHLEQLMEVIVKSPGLSINELSYLREWETHELLHIFNATTVAYPNKKSIVDLFEEQVVNTPDHVAIVFADQQLTYRELNEASNGLAHHLIMAYNLQPGDFAGLMMERSAELLIGILGILKSGAAYVPIDPLYPQMRKEFILQDTSLSVLLTQSDYIFDLDYYQGHIFAMDLQLDSIAQRKENTGVELFPSDLSYVMYTSGSTGHPKGVMIEHGSAVRLVKSTNYVHFSSQDVLLSTGSISFDATTFEYWGMLLNGGTLVLCRQEELMDAGILKRLIQEKGITMMWFTSSWFNQLVDADMSLFEPLTRLLVGGDKLSKPHVDKLQRTYPSLQIINGYGPTENTTFSTTFTVKDAPGIIPIGKPINNSTAYIIDQGGNLCPIGGVGEICLGGPGLARGYLNNAVLTAEKFVNNPFKNGDRIYKTGDLGRWLPDGNIAFMGRKDAQVKIRGYRIELGEIENALLRYESINANVVVLNEKAGEKYLIAYLTSKETLNVSALRDHLSKQLPSYMLPSHYVQLQSLPLTSNGKIDHKSLPAPEGQELPGGVSYTAPRNETEERLVKIWEEVLGKEKIGIQDNFFTIGGNSINAIAAMFNMKKELLPDLTLEKFYDFPTISELLESDQNDYRNEFMIRLNDPSEDQVNIYFMPSILGTSLMYRPIADRLKDQFNCIGFKMNGIDNDEELNDSIEDTARFISQLIMQIQKHAPFVLIGYSFSAYIAFELAKILEQNGYLNFKLLLIDSYATSKEHSEEEEHLKEKEIELFIEESRKNNFDFIDEVQMKKYENVTRNNFINLKKYKINGSIHKCIYGIEANDNERETDMNQWSMFTTKKVSVRNIPGTHSTILYTNEKMFDDALLNFINSVE